MLEFIAGLAVGAATMLTLGARWRRKRRRVDELHEAMLAATWAVQDTAVLIVIDPPTTDHGRLAGADRWQRLRDARDARNTAARRYFAAVGE